MKRLSPTKRNQLILAILGTLAAVSLVYFFLIGPQNKENVRLHAKNIEEQSRLENIKKAIGQAEATAKDAAEVSKQLNLTEADVATGDLFIWTYDLIRQFKANYQVVIPTVGQPSQPDTVDLIPGFPYKQIKFSIMGTGYYHDIGKFIADLENKFPHMRVVNLAMDPGNGLGQDKLSFHLEIVALVKPNA